MKRDTGVMQRPPEHTLAAMVAVGCYAYPRVMLARAASASVRAATGGVIVMRFRWYADGGFRVL